MFDCRSRGGRVNRKRRFEPRIAVEKRLPAALRIDHDAEHVALHRFVQVAKIDRIILVDLLREYLFPIGRQGMIECGGHLAIGVANPIQKAFPADPFDGHGQPIPQPVQPQAGVGEIDGDLRQIPPHEHPPGEPRFEHHHAESLGQAGRQEDVGRGQIFGEGQRARFAHLETARQIPCGGRLFPHRVAGQFSRI
ncbi:MAG TPA: hypothetical protein DD670_15690 [Planctomycetaceae bacterium]|nr:hypothetical protein [Planctomycetaceae bacterium]